MSETSEHSTEPESPSAESLENWIKQGRRIWAETYADPPVPEYEFNFSQVELGPEDESNLKKWNGERADDLADLAVLADDSRLTSKIPGFRRKIEAQARILDNRGDFSAIRDALTSIQKRRDQAHRSSFLCGFACGLGDSDLVRELGLVDLVLRSDHHSDDFQRAVTSLAVTLNEPELIEWSDHEGFRSQALVELAVAGGTTERRRVLAEVDPNNSWNMVRPVFKAIAESNDSDLHDEAVEVALEMRSHELRALALSELSRGNIRAEVCELAVAASEAPQLRRPAEHRVIYYEHHASVFSQPTISARDNVLGSLAVSTGDLLFAAELESDRHAQRVMSRLAIEEDRVELARTFDGPYERAVALSALAVRRHDVDLAEEALELAEGVPGGRVAIRCVINLLRVFRKPNSQLTF